MRLVDILSSIPWLVLVTVLALFMGQGITSIILVILWLNVSINVMFLGAGVNGMRACSRRNG